jgi:hypothetical protein
MFKETYCNKISLKKKELSLYKENQTATADPAGLWRWFHTTSRKIGIASRLRNIGCSTHIVSIFWFLLRECVNSHDIVMQNWFHHSQND